MTVHAIKTIEQLTMGQLADLIQNIGGIDVALKIIGGGYKLTINLEEHHILPCTAQMNLSEFIGDKKRSLWLGPPDGDGLEGEGDQDQRSTQLKEIDWAQVTFITCLQGGEKSISGEEKLRRLKDAGHVRFGTNILLSLWEDYRRHKQNSTLEWLYRTKQVDFIDFYGFVLRNSDKPGERSVFYLYRDDAEWKWSCSGTLSDLPWEKNNTSPILPQKTAS